VDGGIDPAGESTPTDSPPPTPPPSPHTKSNPCPSSVPIGPQVKGGQHVNMVADQVVQKLMAAVKKRNKGQVRACACLRRGRPTRVFVNDGRDWAGLDANLMTGRQVEEGGWRAPELGWKAWQLDHHLHTPPAPDPYTNQQ
jgi:hypothetical protein